MSLLDYYQLQVDLGFGQYLCIHPFVLLSLWIWGMSKYCIIIMDAKVFKF